jgi:hypothetical protein
MAGYYECSGTARLSVLRAFEYEAPRRLVQAESVDLLTISQPGEDDESEGLLESETTVYGVRMSRLDTAMPTRLSLEELRRVQAWLVDDVSDRLDADHPDRGVLSFPLHLGQPVDLGPAAGAALRVAIGAPLILAVAEDSRLGSTFEQRLRWLEERLDITAQKLDAIARNYGSLREKDRP